jgi:hypothetical protein
MTSQEQEQYEWLLETTFDTDFDDAGVCRNPMPKRLVDLHDIALTAGRRIGLSSVPKSTMVCLAIMAGCFESTPVVDDRANVNRAPVFDSAKRRRGRPTNKEREARALTGAV